MSRFPPETVRLYMLASTEATLEAASKLGFIVAGATPSVRCALRLPHHAPRAYPPTRHSAAPSDPL
jgi:hypothetical protein